MNGIAFCILSVRVSEKDMIPLFLRRDYYFEELKEAARKIIAVLTKNPEECVEFESENKHHYAFKIQDVTWVSIEKMYNLPIPFNDTINDLAPVLQGLADNFQMQVKLGQIL